MLKSSLLIALILVLALPVVAATTGDPIDSNDGPAVMSSSSTLSMEYPGCEALDLYPSCIPCMTQCLYAMIADAWCDGDWDNDVW